jgi:hypothetical protein
MIYTYKNKSIVNSGGKLMFSIILFFAILCVVSFTLKGILIGCVLIIVSLFFMTSYEGVQIDTGGRSYRTITSIFFIKKGVWKKLPPISKITIIECTESIQAGNRYNNSMLASKKIYILRLHVENSSKVIVVGRFLKQKKADFNKELLSVELLGSNTHRTR